MTPEEGYRIYRGKCREISKALVVEDPSLRLVRGHYLCPYWGEQAHWWCERADGAVVDPTSAQFPSNGTGMYIEFDGTLNCDECSAEVQEEDAVIMGNYATCSNACAMRLVGL